MALAVRTLPIHLDPVDGEALDSWLEALCRQMGCTWGDFAEAVGLPPPPRGIRTPAWLIRLAPTEARALHAATGTSIQILHSMTLAQPRRHRTGVATRYPRTRSVFSVVTVQVLPLLPRVPAGQRWTLATVLAVGVGVRLCRALLPARR